MILIKTKNKKYQDALLKVIDKQVSNFEARFSIKVPVVITEDEISLADKLLWGEEERKSFQNKEELINYLDKCQSNAIHFKESVPKIYDKFDALEIALDLLSHVLKNKPLNETKTIPTLKDFKDWVNETKVDIAQPHMAKLEEIEKQAKQFFNTLDF